jgi:hypothetical protein
MVELNIMCWQQTRDVPKLQPAAATDASLLGTEARKKAAYVIDYRSSMQQQRELGKNCCGATRDGSRASRPCVRGQQLG